MRNKLLNFTVLLSLAILSFSFTNIKSEGPKSPTTCNNVVTVSANGVTIVRVEINSVSTIVNIPPGGHHDFTSPYYVQGASITVSVYLLGQGAAPRMYSLEVVDPFTCTNYPGGATQGTTTAIKPCGTMNILASHVLNCP